MTELKKHPLMKAVKGFVAICLVTGTLAGCSYIPRENTQRAVEPDRVSLRLAEAADRATRAMETLASVEKGRGNVPPVDNLDNVPAEMKRTVTVTWVGPVAPLVRTLADRAGYQFGEMGDQPSVAVVISIQAVNRPLIDVLRDVGLQLGARATMVVDGTRRMIEVRYAPIDG